MPDILQPSFNKGELHPSLYGRVDTAAYSSGLATARNVVVHTWGGVSNRNGLEMIAPVIDPTNLGRLWEFQFKTTDRYLMEFNNNTLRFYRGLLPILEPAFSISATPLNGQFTVPGNNFVPGDMIYLSGMESAPTLDGAYVYVTASGGTFAALWADTRDNLPPAPAYTGGGLAQRVFTIGTPWVSADLAQLKFAQSADVLTISHKNYPTYELRRSSDTSWSLNQPVFIPTVTAPEGLSVTVNKTGTTTERYKMAAIDAVTGAESVPAREAGLHGIIGISQANPGVVTTNTPHLCSDGDTVRIEGVNGMTEINGREITIQVTGAQSYTLLGENTTLYGAYTSGGNTGRTFVEVTNSSDNADATNTTDNTITCSTIPGASKYVIYKDTAGVWGFMAYCGAPSGNDTRITPDATSGPIQSRNPFLGSGNQPGVVGYYEQRRIFGGSLNNPDTNYFSQTGSQTDFSISTPSVDSDAITATMTSRQVNEIRHYVSVTDLIVFTAGEEWRVNANGNAGFSSTTLTQKPQTSWGSSHIPPVLVGQELLFIPASEISVRNMGYQFQTDSYNGRDVSQLSAHLFSPLTVLDQTYAKSPDPILQYTRSDGQALCMTYDTQQDVIGWTHWDTANGAFQNLCVTRFDELGPDDVTYAIVYRVVNGRGCRYIELMRGRRQIADVRDAFFVDCGKTYDNPTLVAGYSVALDGTVFISAISHGLTTNDQIDIDDIRWSATYDDLGNQIAVDQLNGGRFTVTVTDANNIALQNVNALGWVPYIAGGTIRKAVQTLFGLHHLYNPQENTQVIALADGGVVKDLTINSDGSVVLPRKASRVHIGYQIIADVVSLPVEQAQNGTIQAKQKREPKVTLRVQNTRGLFTGSDFSNLVEWKQREYENMGDPTALFNGSRQFSVGSAWGPDSQVYIRQQYPLPFTILDIIPTVETGD